MYSHSLYAQDSENEEVAALHNRITARLRGLDLCEFHRTTHTQQARTNMQMQTVCCVRVCVYICVYYILKMNIYLHLYM